MPRLALLILLALGLPFAGTARAATITLTPLDMTSANLGASNCEPGCIYTAFPGIFPSGNDGSLDLYYKADVGSQSNPATKESGDYKTSYATVFSNTALDPQNATISFVGGDAIPCPTCLLAVKDGNHNPSYYFYDLSAWNGTDTIELKGFWPNGGAISHVSIWGFESDIPLPGNQVPEPATLTMFGLGLIGVASRVRQRMRRPSKVGANDGAR